jgi:hypothetical protein
MELPVGHAGVVLVMDAVYTKQVRLDAVSVVDLLQAASYLQVGRKGSSQGWCTPRTCWSEQSTAIC